MLVLLFALWLAKENAGTMGLAMVISGVVAGSVSYLTTRSSNLAKIKVTETTTRGDIEREAFERAESYYTNVIQRQDAEASKRDSKITEQAAEIRRLNDRVDGLERKVEHYRRAGQRLARGVHELRQAAGVTLNDPKLDEVVLDMLSDDS